MRAKFTTVCSRERLSQIRGFVRGQLRDLPISEQEKDHIILAVDEACANAIIHGNNCDERKKIQVELDISPDRLQVDIHDIGDKNFNHLMHYEKDMQEIIRSGQKGGMGLKLIYAIMDHVEYYTHGDRKVCKLVKNLK